MAIEVEVVEEAVRGGEVRDQLRLCVRFRVSSGEHLDAPDADLVRVRPVKESAKDLDAVDADLEGCALEWFHLVELEGFRVEFLLFNVQTPDRTHGRVGYENDVLPPRHARQAVEEAAPLVQIADLGHIGRSPASWPPPNECIITFARFKGEFPSTEGAWNGVSSGSRITADGDVCLAAVVDLDSDDAVEALDLRDLGYEPEVVEAIVRPAVHVDAGVWLELGKEQVSSLARVDALEPCVGGKLVESVGGEEIIGGIEDGWEGPDEERFEEAHRGGFWVEGDVKGDWVKGLADVDGYIYIPLPCILPRLLVRLISLV